MKSFQGISLIYLAIVILLVTIISSSDSQQVGASSPNDTSYMMGGNQLFPKPPEIDSQFSPIDVEGLVAVKGLNISKYIDFAEGLSLTGEQIIVFIIKRSDGSYEQYQFPADYEADIKTAMNLSGNDKIIYSNPVMRPRSTPIPFIIISPTANWESPTEDSAPSYSETENFSSNSQPTQVPNPYP